MAKSSKKRKQASQPARQTKKQIALGRKEARQNRIILLSVGAVVLLIVIVLIVGLASEVLIKPANPVAVVNDTNIRSDDYQALTNYRRYNTYLNILNLQASMDGLDPEDEANEFLLTFYGQQLEQLQSSLALIPDSALDELVDDVLVQEKAEEAGIVITEADVEETINEELRLAANPQPQEPITGTEQLPTPTPLPQKELDEIYQNALNRMQLTDKEYRTIRMRDLYRAQVEELLASQVPTTGLVIHSQLIKTTTEEEILEAQERIGGGEDFAIVAQEVSTDTLSAETGGDLGWVTPQQLSSRYGQDLADVVLAMNVNETSVIQSGSMWYLVQVLDRNENGELPEEQVAYTQSTVLFDWLAERREAPDVEIERLLTPDQIPPDPFTNLLRGF
jgi:parvulin-like peptidyl-prolyl isomerase